ncbi:3D domain-containing protein [Proteiniborus sp. MB09-C3]|uniref:3D domain-containing protein n=1 Tax=Proteiniborus sp. MB09-C3 TaxID=3050072 RepID=UPI002557A92E|nr:3D domain-containing protein [Proteiniborus sp. MB09-C3]WIV12307.1 3D domain-containing protein [Proteiniborus sp. MB09-C3]
MEQKNRGYRLLVITALILTGITVFSLAIYDVVMKKVDIVVDGKEMSVNTSKKTVSEVLKEKNISLGESDDINIPVDSPLKDNIRIEIKKAVPVVINYGGNIIDVNTTEETVKGLLDSLKLDYYQDIISPSLDEKVKSGTEINIVKIDEKIETINETVAYKTIIKDNINLDKGKLVTVQGGKEGIKEIKIKKVYENGKLLTTEIIKEKTLEKPIDEIVEKGTKEKEYTIASRGTFAGKREIEMVATAYDLSYESTGKKPGDKWYGITASGTKARPGVVAVDPKVIPLGTKLYVESLDGTPDYGYAIAEDTGGAIKGNKIDLFIEDAKDVKAFGRRKVKVYIIGK